MKRNPQEHLRYPQMTRTELVNLEYVLRKGVASRRDEVAHAEGVPAGFAKTRLPDMRRDLAYYEEALRLWLKEMKARGLTPQMENFSYRGFDSRLTNPKKRNPRRSLTPRIRELVDWATSSKKASAHLREALSLPGIRPDDRNRQGWALRLLDAMREGPDPELDEAERQIMQYLARKDEARSRK